MLFLTLSRNSKYWWVILGMFWRQLKWVLQANVTRGRNLNYRLHSKYRIKVCWLQIIVWPYLIDGILNSYRELPMINDGDVFPFKNFAKTFIYYLKYGTIQEVLWIFKINSFWKLRFTPMLILHLDGTFKTFC